MGVGVFVSIRARRMRVGKQIFTRPQSGKFVKRTYSPRDTPGIDSATLGGRVLWTSPEAHVRTDRYFLLKVLSITFFYNIHRMGVFFVLKQNKS